MRVHEAQDALQKADPRLAAVVQSVEGGYLETEMAQARDLTANSSPRMGKRPYNCCRQTFRS